MLILHAWVGKRLKNSYLLLFHFRLGMSPVFTNNAVHVRLKLKTDWAPHENGHVSFSESGFTVKSCTLFYYDSCSGSMNYEKHELRWKWKTLIPWWAYFISVGEPRGPNYFCLHPTFFFIEMWEALWTGDTITPSDSRFFSHSLHCLFWLLCLDAWVRLLE